MSTIKLKSSSGTNAPTSLIQGELAINTSQGKLYFSHGNSIKSFTGTEYPNISLADIASGTATTPSTVKMADIITTFRPLHMPLTGGTMAGVINMNGSKITNIPVTVSDNQIPQKKYADDRDGNNLPPMVGYSSLERQVPIIGDYGFASVFQNPVFGFDSADREVFYYTTKTPDAYFNTYVGYRQTESDTFTILPNPISHPVLADNEYIYQVNTMGDGYIVLVTANKDTNTPMRRVIFLTQDSIDTSKWTLLHSRPYNSTYTSLNLVKRGDVYRILRVIAYTNQAILYVEDLDGNVLKSQELFLTSRDVTVNGTNITAFNFMLQYYLQSASTLTPAIYDVVTGKFIWSSAFYTTFTVNGAPSSAAGLINIPSYINPEWVFGTSTVSGFGNQTPVLRDGFRYIANAGTAGNVTTAWGTCPIYTMCKGNVIFSWRTYTITHAANYARLGNINNITNMIAMNGSGTDTIMPHTLSRIDIPSPVYWAKYANIHPGFLDHGLISMQQMQGSTTPVSTTSYSLTEFQTVFQPNDLMILNAGVTSLFITGMNTEAMSDMGISTSSTFYPRLLGSYVKSNGESGRCAPIWGKCLWRLIRSGDNFNFEKVMYNGSVFVPPALPAGYTNNNLGNAVWNGEYEASTFWFVCDASPAINTTGYILLKASRPNSSTAYTWERARTDFLAPAIAAAQKVNNNYNNKYVVTHEASLVLTPKYLYILVRQPVGGDTHPYTYRYSITDMTAEPSYKLGMSWYPSTASYGVHNFGSGYSPTPYCFGYTPEFGIYYISSGNSNLSNAIVASRDPATGATATEEEWWDGTKRYTKWVIASPNTGLVVYVQTCPIFIGGYLTSVESSALDLTPDGEFYIHVSAGVGKDAKAKVSLASTRSADTFTKVCIGKVTTGPLGIRSTEYYPTKGLEGIITDLKIQIAAIKAARV